MELLNTVLSILPKPLTKTLLSIPTTLLLPLTLQSLLFTLSLTSLLLTILTLLTFPYTYSKPILTNPLTKTLLTLLFLYLKIWQSSSTLDVVVCGIGYACGGFVVLYVYDCGMTVAEAYVGVVRGWYWGQVGVGVGGVGVGLGLLRMVGYSEPLFVCLVGEILVIITRTAFKNKHIIFSVIPSLIIISIPLLRHLRQTNPLTQSLPLQTIPPIMMAFSAQYRQHQSSTTSNKNSQKQPQPLIFEMLKSCVCFMLYASINGNGNGNGSQVYLEHLIGGIWMVIQLVRWQ